MKKPLYILFIFPASLIAMFPGPHRRPDDSFSRAYSEYCGLVNALRRGDYTATKQKLEEGVSPDEPIDRLTPDRHEAEPLRYANSVALAELLITHGARIPKSIVEQSYYDDYPADLLKFYLEKGARPEAINHLLNSLSRYAQSREDDTQKILENRLAKVRLLLRFGANPYTPLRNISLVDNTTFHIAAKKCDEHFCTLVVDFETMHQKEFLTFLLCCKSSFPRFYAQKDILRMLWNSLTPNRLLATKNLNGETAWDIWGVDWLKSK